MFIMSILSNFTMIRENLPPAPNELVRLLEQCYLTGDCARGLELARQAGPSAADWPDQAQQSAFYLYQGLLLAAEYSATEVASQPANLAQLRAIQQQFAHWRETFASALPGYWLISAELARLTGDDLNAMAWYDQAMRAAEELASASDIALACECAARFYISNGIEKLARAYMQDAYRAYIRWGVAAKAAQLQAAYPQWLTEANAPDMPQRAGMSTLTSGTLTSIRPWTLDVMTVIRASQSLSQEVRVARLLTRLMELAMEQAGASRGLLLECQSDRLLVQARAQVSRTANSPPGRGQGWVMPDGTAADFSTHPHPLPGGEFTEPPLIELVPARPLPEGDDAPLSILNYVVRTHTPVILNEVSRDDRFASDPYFAVAPPAACLGLPMLHQQMLKGVLYLENRWTSGAFTPDRLDVLQVLAAQAAISIEHAVWYEHLEQKISARTADLAAAKQAAETAQAAAEMGRERFRALSEAAFEGILIHAEGRILEINAALEQLSGYTRDELLRREIFDLLAPDAREEARQRVASGVTAPYETYALRRDGARLPVEIQTRIIDWQGHRACLIAVRDITWRQTLEEENRALRATLDERDRLGRLVGRSPGMHKVYDLLIRAAATDNTVIIYGETGVGKELAAQTLFELSTHHARSFVPVNCGAIQEALFESQFFGYRKGAFTGAQQRTTGYFEDAEGGTLFLDEVGELTLTMQAKLLRVLNDGTYTPVGATAPRTADVRLISATNRNLRDMLASGAMRPDFFHRLHVISIELPPLRIHKEDIPLLIAEFLARDPFASKLAPPPDIPDAIRVRLQAYEWPGNVRELYNELRRYLTTGDIELGGLPLPRSPESAEFPFLQPGRPFDEVAGEFAEFYISRALQQAHGQKKKAAADLQMDRTTLHAKLKKFQKGK